MQGINAQRTLKEGRATVSEISMKLERFAAIVGEKKL